MKRGFLRKKSFIFGTTTLVMTFAVIGILIILNLIISDIDMKWDLTADKRFSISQESVKYIKNINKEIKIIAFFKTGTKGEFVDIVKNTLAEYEKYCPSLKISYVDPDKEPVLAKKYEVNNQPLAEGTLVVESGEQFKLLYAENFFDQDYETGTKISKVEQSVTGAISFVNEGQRAQAYFLSGHGEVSLDKMKYLKDSMESNYYIVKEINLFSQEAVPEDANLIAIIGPSGDIGLEDKTKIENYLNKGGKLLLAVETWINVPNIESMLLKYNIKMENDLLIETDKDRTALNQPYVFLPFVQGNDITGNLSSKGVNIVVYGARSFSILNNTENKSSPKALLKTSNNAWGETGEQIQKDQNDIPGPLNIAVASEREISQGNNSKVVVIGDSDFLSDRLIYTYKATGNLELISNSVKWLGGVKESVSISSKVIRSGVFKPKNTDAIIALVVSFLVPVIAIVSGIFVWIRRRHL